MPPVERAAMKQGKKESGFAGVVVLLMTIGGVLMAVGLLIPSLRPLALRVGTWYSLAILALGLGVAIYDACRIVSYPYRRRRVRARESLKPEA